MASAVPLAAWPSLAATVNSWLPDASATATMVTSPVVSSMATVAKATEAGVRE